MWKRVLQALLILALIPLGALIYMLVTPVPRLEPPPAAPAGWVTDQNRLNLGRHMCRAETGEYLGKIEWVGYSKTEQTSVYSTTVVGPPRTHDDGAVTYPVRYITIPVTSAIVTDGKCPDGRP